MSFILDALRKLEQKRQQSPVPDVMTMHDQPYNGVGRRPLWPYLILAVLILNVVILIGWIRPWQAEKKHGTVETREDVHSAADPAGDSSLAENDIVARRTHVPDMPVQKHQKRSIPPVPQQETATGPVRGQLPQPSDKEEPAPVEKDTQEQTQPGILGSSGIIPSEEDLSLLRSRIKEERFPDTGSSSREDMFPSEPAETSDIEELGQLPADIQRELKDVTISGHIYSDNPSSRIVTINGGLMHEGESFTPGVRIDEITMSGIVCTYRGYRFRIRAF